MKLSAKGYIWLDFSLEEGQSEGKVSEEEKCWQ